MLLVLQQTYRYATMCSLLLFFVGSGANNVQAQTISDVGKAYTNMIPPAPGAANLGKYVETPVDLSSGQPSISIPVHTLKGKEISVPISLSYRSGGIKVEEIASWVGLGWSLNAGGVITRTVYGHPDGHPNIRCHFDAGEYEKMQKFINGKPDGCDPLKFTLVEEYVQYQRDILKESTLDTEPDIYFFNFNGYAGKLFIDENFQPHIISYQPMKVEVYATNPPNSVSINREPDSWKITTPDGAQYFFETKGHTHVEAREQGNPYTGAYGDRELNYTSSWYLNQIVSPNYQDTMRFEYTSINAEVDRHNYQMEQHRIELGGTTDGTTNPQTGSTTVTFGGGGKTTHTELFPLRITSNHGESVEFVQSPGREDRKVSQLPRLESVVIKNHQGENLRQMSFYQSYFDSFGVASVSADKKHRYKRLKLDSLSIYGIDNAPTPLVTTERMVYQFGYDPTRLPQRFSLSQDYWGYYNGRGNSTLVPAMTLNGKSYTGADRSADPYYGKACLLNKIVYPTKGYKIFEFEGHSVDAPRSAASTFTATNSVQIHSGGVHDAPQDVLGNFAQINANTGLDNRKSYYKFMTVTYQKGDYAPTLQLLASEDNGVSFSGEQLYDAFQVYVLKVSDNYYTCGGGTKYLLETSAAQVYSKGGPNGGFDLSIQDFFHTHGHGTYQVLLLNTYPHYKLQAVYQVKRKHHLVGGYYPKKQIGGLRIKTIKNYDYNGNQLHEKSYSYETTSKVRTQNPAYRLICPYAGLPQDEDGRIILDSIPPGYTAPVADTNQIADVTIHLRTGVEVLKYGLENHYQLSTAIQKPCILGSINLAGIKTNKTKIFTSENFRNGRYETFYLKGQYSNAGIQSQVLPEKETFYLERFATNRSQLGSLGAIR